MSTKGQGQIGGLDSLDYLIVGALSAAPDLTNKALAEKLGVAESTCAYRRRRLRSSEVIGPSRIDVDHAQLGYALRAVITVQLSSHSRTVVDQFTQNMVNTPHVLQVLHLTGRADFMLTVAIRDGEELKDFILDHVTVHTSVSSTETHIVFSMHRGSWIPSAPRQ